PVAGAAHLHDPGPAGPERRRRLPGRPVAGRAHAGLVRGGGARAYARGVSLVLEQGGVLRGEPVRERLSVLRRHLVPQPRGGARIREAQRRAVGMGAARVVSYPESDHGRGGRPRAVAVRATPGDPAERRVSAFHPHLLERRLRLTRTVVLGAWAALVLVFFRTQ